jgi:SAM-dependent methyltransferase
LCDAYAAVRDVAAATRAYPVHALTCSACRHSELGLKPPEDEIYANYKYFSSNSPDLDAHFTDYAGAIVRTLGIARGAVHVDVGCNDGLLLEKTRALGLRPIGIDPSPAAHRAAAKGLEIHHGYLGADMVCDRNLTGIADVITCNNVMANVRDLLGFGRSIAAMLKDNGAFVVETLHYPTLLRNVVIEMINHEHYHYFSAASIGRFFERIGLVLEWCSHVPTKGANMRCIARKRVPGRPATVDPVLASSEAAWDARAFEAVVARARTALTSAVDAARTAGPVAGFGSSAGTTILMHLFGLQDRIDFLVDDNPSRHGFFAPGSAIPVISPLEYHARKPALTVVFAWRFAEAIIAKHRPNLPPRHQFVLGNSGHAA